MAGRKRRDAKTFSAFATKPLGQSGVNKTKLGDRKVASKKKLQQNDKIFIFIFTVSLQNSEEMFLELFSNKKSFLSQL